MSGIFTSVRNAVESVASVAANFVVPGSIKYTSQLVSKGSQAQLNSPLGQVAQLVSGTAGSLAGNSLGNLGKNVSTLGSNLGFNMLSSVGNSITGATQGATNALSGMMGTGQIAASNVDPINSDAAMLMSNGNISAQTANNIVGQLSADQTSSLVSAVQNGQMTAGDLNAMVSNSASGNYLTNGMTQAGQNFMNSTAGSSGQSWLQTLAGIAIPAIAGAAAVNQVQSTQQNPSQYIVDPLTGKVISSSVTTQSGTRTSLNPMVSSLDAQAASGITNNLGAYNNSLAPVLAANQDLRTQAGANSPGYVNSVVDPLKQQTAAGYGAMVQSNALRGLSGSSLANQSSANYLTDTGRAISDATSSALNNSINLQAGLNTSNANIINQKYNDGNTATTAQTNLGQTIANQDLAAMGKGQAGALAGAQNATQLSTAAGNALSGTAGAITNALGQSSALGGTQIPIYDANNQIIGYRQG